MIYLVHHLIKILMLQHRIQTDTTIFIGRVNLKSHAGKN